jgi:hypothetical protein
VPRDRRLERGEAKTANWPGREHELQLGPAATWAGLRAGPGREHELQLGPASSMNCGVYVDRVNHHDDLRVSPSEARRKRDAEPRFMPGSG